MSNSKYSVKWSIVIIIAIVMAVLFVWESSRIKIETDILESLPQNDPVLASAREVIRHLPMSDRLFINIGQESTDRERLLKAANIVTNKLKESGLFVKIGISDDIKHLPELIERITASLPILFSAKMLEAEIEPLLASNRIRNTLAEHRQSLEQLDGIGRADIIAKDPLGFSGIILRQLSALLPANNAQLYSGHLISADAKNALIIAKIAGSGTDTSTAAKITDLIKEIEIAVLSDPSLKGEKYELSPAGAYRAALDNQTTAKRDIRIAIIFTTLGIALLLFLVFPRPIIGLLALLPSALGAIAALFVCSFLFESVSLLAIGFGGAIMAFTVDLGLTYLLFLDQPHQTYGRQVSRELRSAEFLAVFSTMGAFLLLTVSDFNVLTQIGIFSALGAFFTLLIVQFVFPLIFPVLPPAKRKSNEHLLQVIKKVSSPARWKLIAAIIFGLVMLFFAKPVFNVNMQSMNSVSTDTINAENKLQSVWGNLSGKCYLFLEASSIAHLQEKNEQLMKILSPSVEKEKLSAVFLPTVLFPSAPVAELNLDAWHNFWTESRLKNLRRDLRAASREHGFAADAFNPFWNVVRTKNISAEEIPEKYFEMLGITRSSSGYSQLSLLTAAKNYDAGELFDKLVSSGHAKIFDVDLFNKRLGEFLQKMFLEIALLVSIGIALVVFLFFLSWRLSLAVLSPIAFALCATLGTLKIIGHPLDIPGIMLWIVIMGMGIDYAIYYVCTYQRHPNNDSPAINTVKLATFMAAATTLIGFGVLALADHALLKSIGIVSIFGISYSLIGSHLILPTLLSRIFAPGELPSGAFTTGSKEHLRRTMLRYRLLPSYPRLFSRLKMKIDPMFKELDKFVLNPRRIIDIGSGYGVPVAWLLEIYPQARVFGLEPDNERALIANRALGARGFVTIGRAPDLPEVEGKVDYVLMLDMLHLISDQELQLLLKRLHEKLEADGTLLIRATVLSKIFFPWKRWLEIARLKLSGTQERFRRDEIIIGILNASGFKVGIFASAGVRVEEKWFVATKA